MQDYLVRKWWATGTFDPDISGLAWYRLLPKTENQSCSHPAPSALSVHGNGYQRRYYADLFPLALHMYLDYPTPLYQPKTVVSYECSIERSKLEDVSGETDIPIKPLFTTKLGRVSGLSSFPGPLGLWQRVLISVHMPYTRWGPISPLDTNQSACCRTRVSESTISCHLHVKSQPPGLTRLRPIGQVRRPSLR